MKKALVVATVIQFFNFEKNDIKILKELGYEVHCATNLHDENEKTKDIEMIRHQIDFSRSPFSKQTLVAYKQLKALLQEEHYDLIHCHTPVGGILARLAAAKYRKKGTKVYYTAHGFHFYKGAPFMNWIIYYPIEKICAYFTDVLITINREDYALAQKQMKSKRLEYVPGVGIDLNKFGVDVISKAIKRKELGVPEDKVLLLSVGELNKNKNHQVVIQAMADIDAYYIIAGKGKLQKYLQKNIDEKGLSERVKLIGYRSDVAELYKAADVYVLPSIREGLNVSIMEAMASGLPVVCGKIRGNVDLIDEKGGILFQSECVAECRQALNRVLRSDFRALGKYNSEKILGFSLEMVKEKMKKIYEMD